MSSNRKATETNGKDGGVSGRMHALAALIAAGMTDAAACRQCRVGVTTLWRWKKLPAFRDRVAELQRELVGRSVGRLADLMAGLAVDALTKRLGAKDEKTGAPTATLDDIKTAFELFINTTNAADLKARIEELERSGK